MCLCCPPQACSAIVMLPCCCVGAIDACLANPCSTNGTGGNATCHDLPYPAPNSAAGRSCSCNVSTSSYINDTVGCVDTDACVAWPCNKLGSAVDCGDVSQAANDTTGRTCTCVDGAYIQ